MYIGDRKVKKEIDRIIKENLVKGYLPTSTEVLGELTAYIVSNNLELPSYQYRKIYKDFSLEELNSTKVNISRDINLIYDCIMDLYKLSEKQVDKFETEKKKYDYMLSKLESKLRDIMIKDNLGGYIDSFTENFSDVEDVDMVKTNSEVDINSREVTLKRLKSEPFTDFKFIDYQINDPDNKISVNGDILDYIHTKGSSWKLVSYSNRQRENSIDITIDLGKEMPINKIELDAPLIKSADIVFKVSNDFDKWTEIDQGILLNKYGVDFYSSFRYLLITISKLEADKLVDDKYEYHYIIDTLKLYSINYTRSSTMITNPIKLHNNINKVSLIENSIVPPGTSIDYFVSLNQDNPEWIKINPVESKEESNKVIAFNTVDLNKVKLINNDTNISLDEFHKKHLSVNGQDIYSVTPNGLGEREIIRSKLYKGANAWKVETLPSTSIGTIDKSIFIHRQKDSKYRYKKIIPEAPTLLLNNDTYSSPTSIKYTTTIETSDINQTINGELVSNYPVTIYLNGNLVYSGIAIEGRRVAYPFRKGKNILEVLVNIDKANEQETANVTLDLHLDLLKTAKYIYAESKPMREVSLFNLRFNTNNQKDVYSITKSRNGHEILTKDKDMSIEYLFVYDSINQENDELLFKAVLNRNISVNISPRLISYTIQSF